MRFRQIPSGFYIQAMNSNLHLNDLLLPIGIMNVISILPLLLLVPSIELVTACCLSTEKTPPAPAKVISEFLPAHTRTRLLMYTQSKRICLPLSRSFFFLSASLNYSAAPSLITLPCPSSLCSSGSCVCRHVNVGGWFVRAAEEVLPSRGANVVWKSSASVLHAVFPARSSVHPSRPCRSSRHSCM